MNETQEVETTAVEETVWTVQMICDQPYEAAVEIYEDLSIFEDLSNQDRKRVYGAIKRVRPRPEFKEDYAWLKGYMKENMDNEPAISDAVVEEHITSIESAETAEELGAAAMTLVNALVTGLSPELQRVVDFCDQEIAAITAMVDRNNYQTARRMAYRQIRDRIFEIMVVEK